MEVVGLEFGRMMKEKAFLAVVVSLMLLVGCVSASMNHTVGDAAGWDIGPNLAQWSASRNFFPGDNLVFIYDPTHDVLEVDRMDYVQCRTINPITAYTDGETVISLSSPGTRYFICGRNNYCVRGLRLAINVQQSIAPAPSDSTNSSSPAASPPLIEGDPLDDGGTITETQSPPRSPSDSTPAPGPPIPDIPGHPGAKPPTSISAAAIASGASFWLKLLPLVVAGLVSFSS